jgi:hypothetical protein
VYRTIAVLTVVLILSAPASAGDGILGLGLFKKRQKPPEPTDKVKQLVATLQADPDEKKRRQAAAELRGYDPRNHAEVVPALTGALQRDPAPAVRAEAAESIGKLKPVFQPAGIALEMALTADPDTNVREAVKSALWQYHLNGYRTPPSGNPYATQTAEPPLATARPQPQPQPQPPVPTPAQPRPQPAADAGFRPITTSVGKGGYYQPTAEPPLARPRAAAPPPKPADDRAALPPPKPAPASPDTSAPAPGVPTVTVPPPLPATPPPPSTPTPPGGVPTVSVPPLPGK